MADRSNFFIMQLFHEMKQRFPAIPDRVVSECIRQNFNDKKRCEVILTAKNGNYSQRQFPSSQRSKMLPTSEGNLATAHNVTSTTESKMKSSGVHCMDDSCTNIEFEDHIDNIPLSLTSDLNSIIMPVSVEAAPNMSSSLEKLDNDQKGLIQVCREVHGTPSKFGHLMSQEGCGWGIGGGCCCRHAEDMEFRQLDDVKEVENVRKGVPLYRATSLSSQEVNDSTLGGLGDNELLQTVYVPGVYPPPSSSEQNVDDFSLQASLLNLPSLIALHSDSHIGCGSQISREAESQDLRENNLGSYGEQMASNNPLPSPFQPSCVFDQNRRLEECSFIGEQSVLPIDVEDTLFNLNCSLNASGVSSHFIDGDDKKRTLDVGSKGQASASSTAKVSSCSPFASSSNQKQGYTQGLQPTPVFAGHSLYRSTKESLKSAANPITPNYADASPSSSTGQPIETPLSYTSVNLTVRQPSSDPLPPIDIRSSVGDSSIYSSASSCFPQQTFQSELQIRIGGSVGITSSSGYSPLSPTWKSWKLVPKNQSSNQSSLMAQNNLPNQRPKLLIPSNCGTDNWQHLPQVNRREHADRPESMDSVLANIGKIQTEGSQSDGSKVESCSNQEMQLMCGARECGSKNQLDVRIRPRSPLSSPLRGLPVSEPSLYSHSTNNSPQMLGKASCADHSQSADISHCKDLLMYQIERKNLLEKELSCEREKLKSMQAQTLIMEKDLRERQMQQRRHATLPIMQRVHTLRHEIQALQEECKKMTQEVDLNSDIQVPLGETDEEFYKNIYTGQRGCVLLPPSGPLSHSSRIPDSQSASELRRQVGQEEPSGIEELRGVEISERSHIGLGTSSEGPNWTCSVCTFRNHPALDKCEQCEMPRILLAVAAGGVSLEPKRPCFCHPNKDMPDRPICHLPPDLLPKNITSPPSSAQVVRSPASLDSPSCYSS